MVINLLTFECGNQECQVSEMASELYLVLLLCAFGVFSLKSESLPMGHGMELGRHRISEGHVQELIDVPSPEIFWEKYAKTRTPVVFRGAAKDFPSFHLWTDDYLKKNFGELEVKLESKREKDKVPTGEGGLGRDTINSYLNVYKTKDTYIVSQLPDPMAKDVLVLSCLACGSFTQRILEANLWLSSGGTSSLLHRDADNAINCLLNGTKDWILINPRHESNIPIAEGDTGYGGFAVLDVDSVNLIKYSDFKHVPWHYANITAGDCLYLPYGYWHQVRSYGSMNIAVSVLFSRLKEFNSTGCEKTKYDAFPLDNANMVWTYPGHGPQTLGNSDPFELRDTLIDIAHDMERRNKLFDSSSIFTFLIESEGALDDEEKGRKTAEEIYKALYTFTNGEITVTRIYNLTVEELKYLAMYIEGDPANTEEYEYSSFSPDEVRETIQKAMVIDHGNLSLNTLIQEYMDLGGSEKVGRELFVQLDLNSDGVVNRMEMNEVLDEVVVLFKMELKADLSNDYYTKELQEDKRMMGKVYNEQRDEL